MDLIDDEDYVDIVELILRGIGQGMFVTLLCAVPDNIRSEGQQRGLPGLLAEDPGGDRAASIGTRRRDHHHDRQEVQDPPTESHLRAGLVELRYRAPDHRVQRDPDAFG